MDKEIDGIFVERCRTCFKPITADNSTRIVNKTSIYSKRLQQMLRFILKQINLTIHKEAAICFQCQKSLEISYDFIKTWMKIDEKFFYWAKYNLANYCIKQEHDYAFVPKTTTNENDTIIDLIASGDHTNNTIDDNDNDNFGGDDDDNNGNNNNDDNNNNTGDNIPTTDGILKKKKRQKRLNTLTIDGTIVKYKKRMQPCKRLCEICGKSCMPHQLNKHLKTHNPGNEIKLADQITTCHVCGKQLKNRALLGHLRYTHGDNVLQRYQCEHCGKTFLVRARYRKHLQVHNTNGYPCEVCGKMLKYKHSLQNHQNFYHGIAKYVCDECPRSFSQSKDLKRHKFRVHELKLEVHNRKVTYPNNNIIPTNDDNYECGKCGKLFTKRTSCWVHVRRHDRSFNCDLCNKTLKSRFTLKRHYQIFHLDDCHYYCRCCGKRYYKEVELVNHMLIIHNEAL